MNEFTQEPVVFLNETDSSYDVGAGIIFRKSGVYDVTITGNKTIVSKVSERKTGKWIRKIKRGVFGKFSISYECDCCHKVSVRKYSYCPNCGAMTKGIIGCD